MMMTIFTLTADFWRKIDMYKRIKISFINAGSVTIEEGDWDDYDLADGFIIIKKGEAWVAMYNAKEVFSVVLEK